MTQHKAVAALVLAASVAVSACDAVTGTSSGSPIGVGGIAARTKGAGFTTAPQIAFYRVSGANFVTADGVRDTCFLAAYSEASTGTTTASALSAGAFITIGIGNRVDSLTRVAGSLDPTYRSTLAAGIPYTPGDSMVITVPGDRAGFPASTFRGKTAEAFTMTPLVVPAAGNPINLTWTPASDLHAAMFVTFRYTTGTATSFNRQIACSFLDDGSGQVPATVAADWMLAVNRDMTAQRLRSILMQIDVPLSYFNVVSTFDRPTPVSP
jgi:hypothetical protein